MPTPINSFFRQQSLALSGKTFSNIRATDYDYAASRTWLLKGSLSPNGTVSGTGSSTWSGAIPRCFTNNTVSSDGAAYVSIVNNISDNFTIMCRVKFNTLRTSASQVVFHNGTIGVDGYGIIVGQVSSIQRWRIFISTIAFLDITAAGVVGTGQWYHVALRRTAGAWELFVDGAKYNPGSSLVPVTPTTWTQVGGSATGTGEYCLADITEFVMYNGSFSDGEILRYATAPFI
jgi:hypothetical protein